MHYVVHQNWICNCCLVYYTNKSKIIYTAVPIYILYTCKLTNIFWWPSHSVLMLCTIQSVELSAGSGKLASKMIFHSYSIYHASSYSPRALNIQWLITLSSGVLIGVLYLIGSLRRILFVSWTGKCGSPEICMFICDEW